MGQRNAKETEGAKQTEYKPVESQKKGINSTSLKQAEAMRESRRRVNGMSCEMNLT